MRIVLFGATGKTGRHVLDQALDHGHTVRAVVRTPSRLEVSSDRLEVIAGDMMNREDVRGAITADTDAVIMAAGPVKGSPVEMLEVSARNIVDAMRSAGTKRIVWLTGAGVMDPRDGKSGSRKIIRGIMKLVAGKVLAGSERAYEIVKGSGLDYTIVRPPMLADAPGGTDLQASYTPPKPIPVGRADLAGFLLHAAETTEFIGESPLLSYQERTK